MLFSPAALGLIYLLAVAWPLAKTDWQQHRLPNKLVLPAFPVTLTGQLMAIMLGEQSLRLIHALAVALLVFALGLVANRFAGLGMGDVKLMAAMALALAWYSGQLVFEAVFAAVLLAALAVGLGWVFKRSSLKRAIPLGPYLLIGFLVAAVAGLQG